MAHDLILLAHRLVRLVVFIGFRPVLYGLVAPRKRLLVKIMGKCATFIDKVARQIKVFLFVRDGIELQQRKLDFLMPAVAVRLAIAPAKLDDHVVNITQHDIQKLASPRGLEIGDCPLKHVPGAIELMIVAQIGPAFFRLAPEIPAIEIAVVQLRQSKLLNNQINLVFNILVAPVRKGIARSFNPFADIRVPENLRREVMMITRESERRHGLGQIERGDDVVLHHFFKLTRNGFRQHSFQPFGPKPPFKGYGRKINRIELTQNIFLSINLWWRAWHRRNPE